MLAAELRRAGVEDVRIQRPERNVVGDDSRASSRAGSSSAPTTTRSRGSPASSAPTTAPPGWRCVLELARSLPQPDARALDRDRALRRRGGARRPRLRDRRDARQPPVRRGRAGGARRARPRSAEIEAMVLFDMVGDCDLVRSRGRRTPTPTSTACFADADPPRSPGRLPGDRRRSHAVPRRRDPGGRPDRLQLRARADAGRVLAHAARTTSTTSARRASMRSAAPR